MFSESSVREVAADRAGRRVGGMGRAHHRADAGDRVLAADGEGEHGAGGDERDELAEERLALVLGVVLLCERPGDLQEAGAAQVVAATLETGDDLAAEAAPDAVRLHEDECGFGGHRGAKPSGWRDARRPVRPQSTRAARAQRLQHVVAHCSFPAGRSWRSTGRPARSARAASRTTHTPA